MNIIISGFDFETSYKFVKKIECKYKKITIITNDDNSKVNGKKIVVYNRNDLRVGKINVNSLPIPIILNYLTSSQFVSMLRMFDRITLFKNSTYENKVEAIGRIINFTINLCLDAECVISRERPHFPFEYFLAIHSKSKGIKYRCFGTAEYLRTIQGSRGSLIFDGAGDDCDVVHFLNNSKESTKSIYDLALLNINNRVKKKLHKEQFFANTFLKNENYIKTAYLSLKKFISFCFNNRSKLMVCNSKLMLCGNRLVVISSIIKLSLLSVVYKKYYSYLSISNINRNTGKKILFLGSYQPEETTVPSGRNWDKIDSTVLYCSQIAKKYGYSIFYKEHPSIFHRPSDKRIYRGSSARSIKFYNKLFTNDISLIKYHEDVIDLMPNFDAVVFINGSSIIDCVFSDKPFFIFGENWVSRYVGCDKDFDYFLANINNFPLNEYKNKLIECIKLYSAFIIDERTPDKLYQSLGK